MSQPSSDALESHLNMDHSFTSAQDLGDCYASVGNYEAALTLYSRATELDPDDPRPYIGLGVVALQQEEWDEAETAFLVACRLDRQSSKAYAGLAMVAQQRKQLHEAFQYYLKSMECDTDNLTALLGLFQTSCQMGSFGQVIHYLEIYLRSHPEDTSVLFSLGALYVKDGCLLKAKRVLSHVIDLDPENEQALGLLEEVEHSLTREVATQQITPLSRTQTACTRIA